VQQGKKVYMGTYYRKEKNLRGSTHIFLHHIVVGEGGKEEEERNNDMTSQPGWCQPQGCV
jgi:hypothetical protein